VWRDAAKTIETLPWKPDELIWIIGSKLCTKKRTLREKLCSQSIKYPVNTFFNKTVG